MQAGRAAGARTAAGLQPAAASHGAFSHSLHHTPSRLKSQYARDADSGVLVLERQHPRLVQPSAESRLLHSSDLQQQTLWSPDEHVKLLQSQLQPAQRIHQELLHLQQHHVGVSGQQRNSTGMGSIGKEAQDSIKVFRGQVVAVLAAATVDDAGKPAADIRGSHESDSSRTAARLWKGRRPASAPSQSTAPAPAAVAASPTDNNSSKVLASSNGATSSEGLIAPPQQQLLQSSTAGSSDSGTAASAGSNNESSIASVLQQLQQKLGQQFSPKNKPKAAAAAADHVQKPGKQQLQPPPQPIQQGFPSDQLQRRKPQSPSRTLRKTPQSAVDLVTNGTEFVKFGAGKLRALYPDRRHAGSSLQRLQETTAVPLADLVRVIDTAKAPETARLRLIHDWRNSPRMPADLQALQQQLVTFGQIADLLGGPETAKEILSSDSTYMVMQLEQLRQQLMHLQQLVSSPLLIVPSVVDRGTSAAAAAASVTTGSSSLAAIKQRLASRQQQQQQQQGAAALPLAAFLQSPSSSKSEAAHRSTGGDPSSNISKSDGLGGSSSSSSSGSSTSSSSGSSNSTNGSKQPTLHADVLAIVRCQPGILWLRPDDLRARLAALQQALGAKYITDVLQVSAAYEHYIWLGPVPHKYTALLMPCCRVDALM